MKSAKILIAHNAETMPIFSDLLYDFDLVTAIRLAEAERVVKQDDVDLIVIGLHFDDSRAIDLGNKNSTKQAPRIHTNNYHSHSTIQVCSRYT